MTTLQTIHGVPVLLCASEGRTISGERDALDLIGDAGYQGAQWVVIPAERFDEAFFELSTRVAGDVIQKFVNYRVGVVVLGDISRHTTVSSALRDFVRECNRGRQTWFLADVEELRERLKGSRGGLAIRSDLVTVCVHTLGAQATSGTLPGQTVHV